MTVEHPLPTPATEKQLYATAYYCAFPSCREPLYRADGSNRVRVLNSRVAHIAARREGGPRWEPDMSSEMNRSCDNLLLLCLPHAAEIDTPASVPQFPSDLLREWKRGQIEEHGRLDRGFQLSDDEVAQVANVSFGSFAIDASGSELHLGGTGGQAPGAGGGGGGAIGPGAVGGEGGGGGDTIHGFFRAEDLPNTIEVKVGRGGRAAGPGEWGEDGEETRFGDLLVAKGGRGGRPARGAVEANPGASSSLAVTTIMLADVLAFRDGVVFILGGGWTHFDAPALPTDFEATLYLAIHPSADFKSKGELVQVSLKSPSGAILPQWEGAQEFDGSAAPVVVVLQWVRLRGRLGETGRWQVVVAVNDAQLGSLPFEVRLVAGVA